MPSPEITGSFERGRDVYAQRIEQGDSPADAFTAALEAGIAAERATCVAIVHSWTDVAGRYSEGTGGKLIRKIVDDLEGKL